MTPRLPNEFALAVECCGPGATGRASRAVQIARTVDWRRFLATCRRHRIQGLAWRAIGQFRLAPPADIASQLESDAVQVATDGLKSASISLQLLDNFERDEIQIMFVKGLTLSRLAYADSFVKMSHDVDILVPLADVTRAGATLANMGYLQTLPRGRRLASWHRVHKESVWTRPDSPTIELHSRLADNGNLIPLIGNASPTQLLEVAPGIALPTLAPDELVTYLSVHGASSAWFRLKWIADFAALLAGRDSSEIDRLAQRAGEFGAGRAMVVALSLASRLFGISVGRETQLASDTPACRLLVGTSYRQLLAEREPTERFLGTASIHLSQLLLKPGLAFLASEFSRQVRTGLARG